MVIHGHYFGLKVTKNGAEGHYAGWKVTEDGAEGAPRLPEVW